MKLTYDLQELIDKYGKPNLIRYKRIDPDGYYRLQVSCQFNGLNSELEAIICIEITTESEYEIAIKKKYPILEEGVSFKYIGNE